MVYKVHGWDLQHAYWEARTTESSYTGMNSTNKHQKSASKNWHFLLLLFPNSPLQELKNWWGSLLVWGSLLDKVLHSIWDCSVTVMGNRPNVPSDVQGRVVVALEVGRVIRPNSTTSLTILTWDFQGSERGEKDWIPWALLWSWFFGCEPS